MIIVPPAGQTPNTVLLIGEAPGRTEAARLQPFVGRSGQEQERYLSRHNLTARSWRRTNVIQTYTEGNPDPSPEQIDYWTPHLLSEIATCTPRLIIAVGGFAARWFLGESTDLNSSHGLPHHAGAFDPTRADRAPSDVCILPIYHPAGGFYDVDARTLIAQDYAQVASVLSDIRKGRTIDYRHDLYSGQESYLDVTGTDLSDLLQSENPTEIGLDTEGTPDRPWSVQISTSPGSAYVLRTTQPDFLTGASAIQSLSDRGCTFVLHNAGTPSGCMYDVIMCRSMGVELSRATIWDTMYAAYLLRTEPKGLKDLSWRWLGMRMTDYQQLIGDIGRTKQIDYLSEVVRTTSDWSKPDPQPVYENDGTCHLYRPQAIDRRAQSILTDIDNYKPVDPFKRWKAIPKPLRKPVESILGLIPTGSLEDVPIDQAIHYAGRDADATLRLKSALSKELSRLHLLPLMSTGMSVLPVFEEMQRVGMPASRKRFIDLSTHVESTMHRLQSRISHRYYKDKPFNPGSSKQVATLMRRRGLIGEKRTPTGSISTSKRSIEHLRHTDPAIADVMDWKEHQKVLSTYCLPILEIADDQPVDEDNPDLFIVHCNLKPVTVETRRLSAEDPSLLNQPVRTELGRKVRDCYVTPPGKVFGAWDYSGQEMRVAAHVSQDPLLCKLFRTGGDPHTEAAVRIFGVPADKVDKFNHRLPAKTANFGILYGLSGSGLQDLFRMFGLSWAKDECDRLIREILKTVYPGLSACIQSVQQETLRTGQVSDLFGMIRYLPAVWSQDKKESAEAGRQAFSHLIQGTAQGMTQNMMAYLRPEIWGLQDAGLGINWCLQIHDEVLFIMDDDLWDVVDPLVTDAITSHSGIRLRVPIEAEGHMSTSWSGLK